MADEAAKAVIRRYWGNRAPIDTTARQAPIEQYLEYKGINPGGWGRIIQSQGKEDAQAYREAMQQIGRDLGLEG